MQTVGFTGHADLKSAVAASGCRRLQDLPSLRKGVNRKISDMTDNHNLPAALKPVLLRLVLIKAVPKRNEGTNSNLLIMRSRTQRIPQENRPSINQRVPCYFCFKGTDSEHMNEWLRLGQSLPTVSCCFCFKGTNSRNDRFHGCGAAGFRKLRVGSNPIGDGALFDSVARSARKERKSYAEN